MDYTALWLIPVVIVLGMSGAFALGIHVGRRQR